MEVVVETMGVEVAGIVVTAIRVDIVEEHQMVAAGVMAGAEEALVPIFRAARAVEET